MQFHYLGCTLDQLDAECWMNSDNIVARLNLPNMAYSAERRVDVYAQAVRGLTRLEPEYEKRVKYLDFIDIYTGLDDNERKLYEQRYPEEVREMSAFAERFREEGRAEGIEKGIEKGVTEGEAAVLLKQLQIRFGDVSPEYERRIHGADQATLLDWAGRILTVETIEDIFT